MPHQRGVPLIALSACGFGAMAIFAKQAYAAGFEVASLLSLRFAIAALVFWAIVAARGTARPSRRTLLAGLGLGGIGYAVQAGLFFGALERVDASLTSLLLYTHPVLVVAGAVALGRERLNNGRAGALALASAGAALVLLGGHLGALDGLGVAMALGASVVYAAYILVADRTVSRTDPFLLAALVMTGATVVTTAFTLATGGLAVDVGAAGFGWLACVTLVSTVFAVSCFFSGLPRVGPGAASIVSTIEPVVTVGLAIAVFGEALGATQAAGGVLVLGAVVVLGLRAGTVGRDEPAADLPAASPARALAGDAA